MVEPSKQQQGQQTVVIVTTCPPGCGINCNRVFDDSLGLGYRVYCKCPICHPDNVDSKRRKVVVAEGEPQLHEQLQPIQAHQPMTTEVGHID